MKLFFVLILLPVFCFASQGELGATSTGIEQISITIAPRIDITESNTPTIENIQTACLFGEQVAGIIVDGKRVDKCSILGSGIHEITIVAK